MTTTGDTAGTRFCERCGNPYTTGTVFCEACGGRIGVPGQAFSPPSGPVGAPPPPPFIPSYQPMYAVQTTNGFAIASLVLGILCLYGIGSILALVFGYTARRQIDESHGMQKGRGMATAGVVLGWIGIAFIILFVVLIVIAASNTSSTYRYSYNN